MRVKSCPADVYRDLRNTRTTDRAASGLVADHELNGCDDVDNDGEGLADDLGPDCACDPDALSAVTDCDTPAQ